MAILDHYSSTTEHPRHENCPDGPESWCSWKRDLVNGESTHTAIQNPFTPELRAIILPTFERLGDRKFLEKCKNCRTQNVNESLHSVIWGMAPKDKYTSPNETEAAVNIGVSLYNDGLTKTLKRLYEAWGLKYTSSAEWRALDDERIKKSEFQNTEVSKKQRKDRKRSKVKKESAFKKVEKPTDKYKSGAFHVK